MIKSLYPCFQHWSELGAVYLVSDTHFKDTDRDYMGYFISNEDQWYILNDTCHRFDTLVHLGDVGDLSYIKRLKCHKVLIMGNHDQSIEKMEEIFDEVYSGPLWISQKLVLSHEPVCAEEMNWGMPIAINIHGHEHNGIKHDEYHLNIAQNVYGYIPLNLNQFIKSGYLKRVKDIHTLVKEYAIAQKEANEKWSNLFNV